jgi:hypothetical protein
VAPFRPATRCLEGSLGSTRFGFLLPDWRKAVFQSGKATQVGSESSRIVDQLKDFSC